MIKTKAKKPYEGHEIVYRKMRQKGFLVWGQKGSGSTGKSCHPETNNFLKDVLSQPWAPKNGKVLELGCGTGPILRWVAKRGFTGIGIDVSKTAVAMAKEQSKGLDIKFKQADICNLNVNKFGKFDIVIDGLCLHCIIEEKDRNVFLRNAFELIKKDGLFILLTMCSPIDKKIFEKKCHGQIFLNHTIYLPFPKAKEFEGCKVIKSRDYLPTRKVPHWKKIVGEIKQADFKPKLIRYHANNFKDTFGTLTVGAVK